MLCIYCRRSDRLSGTHRTPSRRPFPDYRRSGDFRSARRTLLLSSSIALGVARSSYLCYIPLRYRGSAIRRRSSKVCSAATNVYPFWNHTPFCYPLNRTPNVLARAARNAFEYIRFLSITFYTFLSSSDGILYGRSERDGLWPRRFVIFESSPTKRQKKKLSRLYYDI